MRAMLTMVEVANRRMDVGFKAGIETQEKVNKVERLLGFRRWFRTDGRQEDRPNGFGWASTWLSRPLIIGCRSNHAAANQLLITHSLA